MWLKIGYTSTRVGPLSYLGCFGVGLGMSFGTFRAALGDSHSLTSVISDFVVIDSSVDDYAVVYATGYNLILPFFDDS